MTEDAALPDQEAHNPEACAGSSPAHGPIMIKRPLIALTPIVSWAASLDWFGCRPAEGLHATLAWSRAPVDWADPVFAPLPDVLTIEGGARALALLDGGAVAMTLESADLQARWRALVAAGASWDYRPYRPHVTLAIAEDGVARAAIEQRLAAVAPYAGRLVFGPETRRAPRPSGA